ncbi:MAG: 7,8-didemethyl-8-hydroxy-5-deazariboflavin synthase [Gammaproteobacteria bacterium]|nr:MAG: 7,8-didemethyl-8-hydroxy-5-deazariboflavin synthase [Gammaproteobacteria bacterium]
METIRLAGQAAIPFTSGILIGLGETRLERIESLLVLRDLHQQYGHLQEIIIQNFRAKPNTLMVNAPEPDLNELIWTIAVARIIFGPTMNLQAPPNLSPGVLPQLVNAGINDWGGVSPVTPDYVNPEAPWPHLDKLTQETQKAGKQLIERLAIYPDFALNAAQWTHVNFTPATLQAIDGQGYARVDDWCAGVTKTPPRADLDLIQTSPGPVSQSIKQLLEPFIQDTDQPLANGQSEENNKTRKKEPQPLSEQAIVTLMQARGADFTYLCQVANKVRQQVNQDTVTYVVNRNINYTNICYFKCQFCAFSKGKTSENLRGKPYDLSLEEIQRRCLEAWQRGATEVCLQGGIHPSYTGQTYLDICRAIKQVCPDLHIHAFSPLEVWQGAKTLGISLEQFLIQLKQAGLDTLPGTAAEILDDEVRKDLCPDKINTQQWQEVMVTAHRVGFKTTATIMFGHIERYAHIARHLLLIRSIQQSHIENTQANEHSAADYLGFTEFVLLPYVHMEAPMHRKGKSRPGPSFREAVALHAISRLVLSPYITNIQASWTKMGHEGAAACLNAGVNDLGGTLMNETITRSAGASHGQETSPADMEKIIRQANRNPQQRGTYYQHAFNSQVSQSFHAQPLLEPRLQTPVKTPSPSIHLKPRAQHIHCVNETDNKTDNEINTEMNALKGDTAINSAV